MSDLIDRQVATDAITEADVFVFYDKDTPIEDAVEIAIRCTKKSVICSVEELPSAEPEQCDDCIWHTCNYNKADWEETENKQQTKQQAIKSSDSINREDAIANVALAIWHFPNELYTSLNCFDNCQELAERALNHLPSAEPEKVLVAEVKLTKEQIQDAVDEAVEKIRAEMEEGRNKGKWLLTGSGMFPWECDQCGDTNERATPWCPHCGRRMEKGEQE